MKIKRVKVIIEKIKKYLSIFGKKVLDTFFNPLYTLSTVFIGIVINSFFTINVEGLPSPVQYIVKDRPFAIFMLLIWIILSFINDRLNNLRNEIKVYEERIKNKTREINTGAEILSAKYGEFTEATFNKNIDKILKLAVKNFALIEACHIYNYELQRVKDNVDIKINFKQGVEQERTCINVVKQNYYRIDKDIFQSIGKTIEKKVTENNEKQIVNDINAIYDKVIESKNISESIRHTLKEILFFMLCDKMHYYDIGLEKEGNSRVDYERSSIIGAIVLGKGWIYKYRKSKEDKNGRMYFATPFSMGQNILMNITIDGRDLEREDIKETFEKIMIFLNDKYDETFGCVNNEKK